MLHNPAALLVPTGCVCVLSKCHWSEDVLKLRGSPRQLPGGYFFGSASQVLRTLSAHDL